MITDFNTSLPRRMRRMRTTPAVRALRRETRLHPSDFVQPVFVTDDPNQVGEVTAMLGVQRVSVDDVAQEALRLEQSGVQGIMLFGVPTYKDELGSAAYDDNGVICSAIRAIREANLSIAVLADVCLCQYTSHGHCGVLHENTIDNDASIELLARASAAYARAGVDMVAPSAMMDGMVSGIRQTLDAEGFTDVGILSYAVKYASAFYGPFREAACSAPAHGGRATHQMDPANAREAIAEAELDLAEGADVLMVKPALPYLDVINTLRSRFPGAPIAAYQVSGEYAMLRAAAAQGWINERETALESLIAIKRAGADIIISYWAEKVRQWLEDES